MLKTYTEFIVDIPANAHVAYTRNSVYITTGKRYLSDKGYNQDSRKCIGKYISPTQMHPNSNYQLFYPAQWEELTKKKSLIGTKKVGIKSALTAISNTSGIKENLKQTFGLEASNAMLDYSMYSIMNHSDATEQFETAMCNHILFSDKVHTDDWYSNFFTKGIDSGQCTKFKNYWAAHCKKLGYEDVYLCFDGSNNDCQAKDVEIAEKGHAKSKNNTNTISYMYAVSENDCTPITFTEYRGGQVDSKAIKELITFLNAFGFKVKGAIIDRYFCNKPVLDYLTGEGINYVVMLTSKVKGKSFMMAKYAEALKWNVKNYIRASEIFGITDKAPIFKESTDDSFIHLYFDWKNGGERAIKLISDTYKAYDDAIADIADGKCPTIEGKAKQYIKIKSNEIDGTIKYEVEFDSSSLQKNVDEKGFSALASSEEMTADDADEKYRKRDNSEVCYKFIKSQLGFSTTRVYSEKSVRSKMFICFLSSIIRNDIVKAAKTCKISTNVALRELSLLESRLLPDDNYIFIHNQNTRQLNLMQQLGITDTLIDELVKEENDFNHGIVKRRRKRKPGPKKGSHNNQYDENGNIIPRKRGPKPGSHHETIRLKIDGTPKQKPGPKVGSKHKINSGN